jgi:hypothetical protein
MQVEHSHRLGESMAEEHTKAHTGVGHTKHTSSGTLGFCHN